MATFQDKTGKEFATRDEAAASNRAMRTQNDNQSSPDGADNTGAGFNSPIGADDLKDNQKPFDLPTPPAPVETTGLQGAIESNTDAFTADLEQKRKEAETKKDTSFKDYVDSKMGTKGETEQTADAYSNKGGVDDIQVELNDINQQILQEKNALRRTVERLETKGGGLASGALAEVNNATRDSLRKQADLTIIQMGVQGRYDSAKAIADRAVAVQLEKDKTKNEVLKESADRNWAEFTEAEKREFETKQGDRERALDDKKTELDRKYALVLDAQQNGAPASVVRAMLESPDTTAALKAGGNYIGLLDRQAKLASIASSETNRLLALAGAGDAESIKKLGFDPSKVKAETDPTTKRQLETKLEAGKNLVELATQYKTLVDKYGFENTIVGNQNIVGQYRSIRAQITAAYKDAKQLGTLDKGVLELMSGIIGEEPTSGVYFTQNLFGGKQNRIINQIDELIETTGRENAQASLRLGIDPTAFEMLSEEDLSEIDGLLGDKTNTSTTSPAFAPNSYYND